MNDDQLLDDFEQGRLSGADFPHERHLRVAWLLAQRYDRKGGLTRMRSGIRSIAARAGVPDKYHETITRAWFELVAQAEDLELHPELLDRGLLGRYYSPERLAQGREVWVAPDLGPLRLPSSSAKRTLSRCGRIAPTPGQSSAQGSAQPAR